MEDDDDDEDDEDDAGEDALVGALNANIFILFSSSEEFSCACAFFLRSDFYFPSN